jgi:hypothetical protein
MRKKRTPPFSLRLTFEQRARLEQEAAGSSLSAYIHERLFGAEAPAARRKRGKTPVKDQQAIAELLAKLGQSRLSSNLNQLARLANLGALPVTPDTETAIIEAAGDIAAMRKLLIEALGLEVTP